MCDDLRGQSTRDDLRGQTTHDDLRGQLTLGDMRGQPSRRQNVTHGWGLPEPRRSNERVGPRFEYDRRRFESNPREQRTRRHESPTVGAQRRSSQRRSPSPYLQKEGGNRDVSNRRLIDDDETKEKVV
jgi:hypothetical protein